MDYTSGTYLIVAKKYWTCLDCGQLIPIGQQHFVRILADSRFQVNSKGVQYQNKSYSRWHLKCALRLNNLSSSEKDLLGPTLLVLHASQEAQEGLNYTEKGKECMKSEKVA